eukprot:TRINITY_DN12731_c0_g1_i1.p1 TRINITY_DN12731_c0_g1~~TRINITY_DN12731_c0_g1_i1.p1  ORF type:complete len:351 (+),score=67.70 TRINITY_DN12731_c0_g1_i1:48-1100(+)
MVHYGYWVEFVVFLSVGVVLVILGALCLYARKFPWNKQKASTVFLTYAQGSSFLCSVIFLILQVDCRGVFGVYGVITIVLLKDAITLTLLCSALMLSQALHVAFLDNRPSIFKNLYVTIGIPMTLLFSLAVSMTIISYQRDEEYYRAAFYIAATVVIFWSALAGIRMLLVILKSDRAFSSRNSITSKEAQERTRELRVRLTRSIIILTAIGIMETYTFIQVLVDKVSLKSSQFADANNYQFTPVPMMFALGLIVSYMHCWLPYSVPLAKLDSGPASPRMDNKFNKSNKANDLQAMVAVTNRQTVADIDGQIGNNNNNDDDGLNHLPPILSGITAAPSAERESRGAGETMN